MYTVIIIITIIIIYFILFLQHNVVFLFVVDRIVLAISSHTFNHFIWLNSMGRMLRCELSSPFERNLSFLSLKVDRKQPLLRAWRSISWKEQFCVEHVSCVQCSMFESFTKYQAYRTKWVSICSCYCLCCTKMIIIIGTIRNRLSFLKIFMQSIDR